MKTLHCVQINENTALMLSNKIYVIATLVKSSLTNFECCNIETKLQQKERL